MLFQQCCTSVPLIQTNENLTKANAIVNQITSLSGLLAPFLAGLFYSIFGKEYFHYIMFLCTVCFLLAASVELHLTIPLQIVGRRIEGDINGKLFFQPFSH